MPDVAEEVTPASTRRGAALLHGARLPSLARLAHLGRTNEGARVERCLTRLRDPGHEQQRDVGVDLEPAGPARGRDAVVAVGDVVVVTDLDEVDRRQPLEPLHGARDALPSAEPVLAAQVRERQEVGRVLRWMPHRADDPVEVNAAQPDPAPRRGSGARYRLQRREHLARAPPLPAGLPAASPPRVAHAAGEGQDDEEAGESAADAPHGGKQPLHASQGWVGGGLRTVL